MTNIVCFKWRRIKTGYQLPHSCDYTAEHVNKLHSMARKHGKFNRFICVTDDDEGIDPDIEIVPLWEDYKELGGCFRRLRMYTERRLGPKFLMIDLDCVITGSIQHLVDMDEVIMLNRYVNPGTPRQLYNGALQLVTPGSEYERVWHDFHPAAVIRLTARRAGAKTYVGSDQAWLSHYFGSGIPTFGPEHGVKDIKSCHNVTKGTCIVFFHGVQDPSNSNLPWVKEHWC
jgi:hypothetical protein